MNRLKQCLTAALVSCFLAVPCLSLADDETMLKDAGGGAIALQTDGKSDLLQAVRDKDYEKALQIVNGQIEAHDDDANAYDRRSAVYALQGRYDEALADCHKAVSLEPGAAFHYFNRGAIYEQRKEYQLAVNDYTKALSLSQNGNHLQGLMYFSRARAYTAMEAYDKALADLRQGEKLAPAFPHNYLLESLVYEKKGDKKLAERSRHVGVMYELMHRGDYFLAGSVAEEAGLYDQSLALLNEAVKHHPDDSRVYSERGLVYAKMGQDELAIADLTKALALKESAMDYNNRGECYRHLKQFDLAKQDYDRSMRMATDDDDKLAVSDSLGQLAMDQGDYKRAVQYLTQALAIKPYEDGYELRSQAWRHLGDTKKAEQDEAAAQEIEQRQLLDY
ncbi:MAG: tetratricopeptide repeat protein [Megasphaera sp.]|uniref:tetratricopeptide repeat protein n=1 Tax=Megasphaera sp. TaxID=2023260 RepID=UPI0025C07D67|nr:tetratricopeptide repeat protein [Megasphaera sp.]MCF0152747.1 tetratricopeptide repeat protein [Megasphaera sp.]MCI7601350.1 tetratricopeptide repeat protein [Megasphaera sp.]